MTLFENRWFTKTGKRKRVPKALEVFRPFIKIDPHGQVDENYLESALIDKSLTLRVIGYNPYALNRLQIFLTGVFSNHRFNSVYNEDTYKEGREYAKMIAAYLTFDQTGWEKL